MNKLKFLLFLCFSVFISYSTTSSAAGLWESAKDEAVKKFAGCYKNAKLTHKECVKKVEADAAAADAKRIPIMSKELDNMFKNCSELAKKQLFECRLEKGKLKPDCTEEQLRKDLSEVAKTEVACEETCDDKCTAKLKDGPSLWSACVRNCIANCLAPETILKEENKVYEKCISTGK